MELATIPPPGPPDDERADARSNIFVVAAIHCAGTSGPVRIRNMSARGALIEGGSLPGEGVLFRLSRGSLAASGTVVWQAGNRAGIRFHSAVSVADWLPRGHRPQQQRIDEAVHAYKTDARVPAPTDHDVAPADCATALAEIETMLRRVAEELASDALACDRHVAAIQSIDVAAEKLAVIAGCGRPPRVGLPILPG